MSNYHEDAYELVLAGIKNAIADQGMMTTSVTAVVTYIDHESEESVLVVRDHGQSLIRTLGALDWATTISRTQLQRGYTKGDE